MFDRDRMLEKKSYGSHENCAFLDIYADELQPGLILENVSVFSADGRMSLQRLGILAVGSCKNAVGPESMPEEPTRSERKNSETRRIIILREVPDGRIIPEQYYLSDWAVGSMDGTGCRGIHLERF